MKLHANAALSLNGRRRMVAAVIEHGRSITEAAAAAGVSERTCLRFTAPELAGLLGMPLSTVSAILRRIGMGRLGRLGMEPARRYERERPGELIHIDVKKLGRITGGAGKRITGIARNPRRARTDAAGVRRLR